MKIECFPQKVYQESWLSKLDLIGTAQPQLVLLIDPPYIYGYDYPEYKYIYHCIQLYYVCFVCSTDGAVEFSQV